MENKNQKNIKGNLYVALLVILMITAIIVAIAGAVVRSVNGDGAVTTNANTGKKSAAVTTEKQKDSEKADVFIENKDTEKSADTTAADTDKKNNAGVIPKFINPTGGTVMNAHSSEVPVFSKTMNDYRTHNGVDISAQPSADVFAAADGTITQIWDDPMMGKCLKIEHSGGAVSTYKNLSEDLPSGIEEGCKVSSGQVIGCAGESALAEIAEESHIHYEIAINGISADPCKYIEFSKEDNSYEG